jgi:hypothetical protein
VLRKKIPFQVRTENGFTPAQERRLLREAAWTEKHGKYSSDIDELLADAYT